MHTTFSFSLSQTNDNNCDSIKLTILSHDINETGNHAIASANKSKSLPFGVLLIYLMYFELNLFTLMFKHNNKLKSGNHNVSYVQNCILVFNTTEKRISNVFFELIFQMHKICTYNYFRYTISFLFY
jgi:hypothetical protein